jgi:hypothetical protein
LWVTSLPVLNDDFRNREIALFVCHENVPAPTTARKISQEMAWQSHRAWIADPGVLMIINPDAGFAVNSQYFERERDLHKTEGLGWPRNPRNTRACAEHEAGFGGDHLGPPSWGTSRLRMLVDTHRVAQIE